MLDLWLQVKSVDLAIALACGAAAVLLILALSFRDALAAWRVRRWNRKADQMHHWPHRREMQPKPRFK
jgi:hypothetical protein